MTIWHGLRQAFLVAATAGLFASTALAHHGWSWAEDEQTELSGAIQEIFIGPPHPSLQVETTDGIWTVDLGNPSQTERSGFNAESAAEGDEILVLGNRSLDRNEKRMKAVRITVNGTTYDIYPERIGS